MICNHLLTTVVHCIAISLATCHFYEVYRLDTSRQTEQYEFSIFGKLPVAVDLTMMNWWLIHYTANCVHNTHQLMHEGQNTVSLVTRCYSLNLFFLLLSILSLSSMQPNDNELDVYFCFFHSWRVPCFLHDSRHFQMDSVAHSVCLFPYITQIENEMCAIAKCKNETPKNTEYKMRLNQKSICCAKCVRDFVNALAIVAASTLQS